MNLRPDFDRCATGYRWLDRLTSPWWRWRARRAEIAMWKAIARPGEHWTTTRARSRTAMRRVLDQYGTVTPLKGDRDA